MNNGFKEPLKIFFLFLVCFIVTNTINGCAVYDPKRGVLVSGSVQTVDLDNAALPETLDIMPFRYSGVDLQAEQNSMFMVGSAFIPVSHTYIFDDVDREYLRASIIQSLQKAGVDVIESKVYAPDNPVLEVEFLQLGMVSGSWGSTNCIITARLTSRVGNSSASRKVEIEGKDMMSVAGAKNDAIKQLVVEVASFLSDQEQER